MQFPFTKANRLSVFERFGNLDWSLVSTFLDGWKDDQDGTLILKKRNKRKSPEQLGYYYGKILPMALKAFKESTGEVYIELHISGHMIVMPMTLWSVDFTLKNRYGEYNNGEFKNKEDMDMAECAAFEDWAIKWLAKFMNCHVPPADQDWRSK